MQRVVQVRGSGSQQGPGAGAGPDAAWVHARPTWALRIAMITFLVIIGLPVLILLGIAFAAAALVFGGLALLAGAGRRIKAALPGHDGRSNVRVKP